MNNTDTAKRAAIFAAILPAYVFNRSRPPSATALPPLEADCATHEEITSLIVDALHFARSKGWEPGELLGDAALAFSAEEDDAPTPADPTGTGASIERAFNMPGEAGEFATGEAPCSACGEPTGEGITCPNGNFVCRACFDAGSDGPDQDDEDDSPSLRVFYVCPCGNEWTEENGPEHGACDSECECGVTVSADHSEEI